MSEKSDSERQKYGFMHRIKLWWNGGESSRQTLRKTTGVYDIDEGFDKPDKPRYHWTAIVIRWPACLIKRHAVAVIIGLFVGIGSGVAVLLIGETWFNN